MADKSTTTHGPAIPPEAHSKGEKNHIPVVTPEKEGRMLRSGIVRVDY